MRPIVVVLAGPSGTGKTAVATTLAAREGWAVVEEAYDRLRPRPSLRFSSQEALRRLERRLVVEEARRYGAARSLARQGRTVVADTPFLDPVAYTAGLRALGLATLPSWRAVAVQALDLARRGRLGLPDLTINLHVAARVRSARAALDVAHHPRGLFSRHQAVGELVAGPLARRLSGPPPGRLRPVSALGPPSEVAARVVRLARQVVPRRDPCAAAIRVLEGLLRRDPLSDAAGNLKKGTLSPPPPR